MKWQSSLVVMPTIVSSLSNHINFFILVLHANSIYKEMFIESHRSKMLVSGLVIPLQHLRKGNKTASLNQNCIAMDFLLPWPIFQAADSYLEKTDCPLV